MVLSSIYFYFNQMIVGNEKDHVDSSLFFKFNYPRRAQVPTTKQTETQ